MDWKCSSNGSLKESFVPGSSGGLKDSLPPGSRVILIDDPDSRTSSMVVALTRLPQEPDWAVVGGFAVIIRASQVHRVTNDVDTISRDQSQFIELLTADSAITKLSAARLRIDGNQQGVDLDVMDASVESPLPAEPSERAFTLTRRHALANSESVELLVMNSGRIVAQTQARIATAASLIALKAVALPRRATSANPQKVGTDIQDLVVLTMGCDFNDVVRELASANDEVLTWVTTTLTKWFSPDHDQRYTLARLRQIASSFDTGAISEHDLTEVALLAGALQRSAQA